MFRAIQWICLLGGFQKHDYHLNVYIVTVACEVARSQVRDARDPNKTSGLDVKYGGVTFTFPECC